MKRWNNGYRIIQTPLEFVLVKENLNKGSRYLKFNIGEIVRVTELGELGIVKAQKDSLQQFIYGDDYTQC